MIDYSPHPGDWIVHGGKPAATLGDVRKRGGMPSFEGAEDGKAIVMDFLVGQLTGKGGMMLLPAWYGYASAIAPEGPTPACLPADDGSGRDRRELLNYAWRPKVYSLALDEDDMTVNYWQGLGSQQELAWRYGLNAQQRMTHFGTEGPAAMDRASDRAADLLLQNLTPFQRMELAAKGEFRCRGAATGNLYVIDPSNGFAIVDKTTGEEVVSYCLHPEYWIPHEDVALATKLALEDRDLEVECLENARLTPRPRTTRPTPAHRKAAELERELIK